jgi:hypothetical protein
MSTPTFYGKSYCGKVQKLLSDRIGRSAFALGGGGLWQWVVGESGDVRQIPFAM